MAALIKSCARPNLRARWPARRRRSKYVVAPLPIYELLQAQRSLVAIEAPQLIVNHLMDDDVL